MKRSLFFRNYSISSTGEIRNESNGYVLKTRLDKDGYPYIVLYGYKKKFTFKIHRLVALAFIPNPNNLPEVNHKDGNKENNNDWNLEWNTTKDNLQHALDAGLRKPTWTGKFGKDHAASKPIAMFNKKGTFIRNYSSASEAARHLKVSDPAMISRVANGKRKQYKKLKFTFI